jgi:hypothetical protein
LRLTVEFALLWAVSAFILAHFGINAVALGSSVVTLAYLPRLLQLYLHPIQCTGLDYVRALAGPAAVSIAIFVFHRVLMHVFVMDAWPQVGIAVVETLAGYVMLLALGHRVITEKITTMRTIFAA